MDIGLQTGQWTRLRELCDSVLSERPLILASNRGPIEYHVKDGGRPEPRRGSGGVVTALNSFTRTLDFTWVASTMGEGDRRMAEESQNARITLPGQKVHMRFISTPRRVYHKFYNILCNPLLWFLQHYMWNSPYNPNVDANVHDAWNNGYVWVNEAFGHAVVEEGQRMGGSPIVMTHDYHLYLVPGYIRKHLPTAIIQHFTHIPWPSPRYWKLLPSYMRTSICESLASADVVGFQTMGDVRNFLDCCDEFLSGHDVDHNQQEVFFQDRKCSVQPYPISINVDEILSISNSPRALEYEQRLRSTVNDNVIVRVDRAEPSKNVVRGFRAFSLLLKRYPIFQGRVSFLAFLVPSRTHIRQYKRYMEEIEKTIEEINNTYGTDEWQPIMPYFENNYTQAIAGMKIYDVLLVNAVIDGMNLVAKEGPLVNSKDGVVILSEGTGAHNQLRHGALTVSPADVEGTMQAMYEALTMGAEERKRRACDLVESIRREDISHWLSRQIEDIARLV